MFFFYCQINLWILRGGILWILCEMKGPPCARNDIAEHIPCFMSLTIFFIVAMFYVCALINSI